MKTIKTEKTEYDIQAEKFLEKTGTTFEAKKIGHFPYFPDDKVSRDVYKITLARGGKTFSFRFGQSIVRSEGYKPTPKRGQTEHEYQMACLKARKAVRPPTPYDVLACIEKYDPGTFSDFYSDFGYSDDSIKARDIYFSVQNQWKEVNRMFPDVLDDLAEIS